MCRRSTLAVAVLKSSLDQVLLYHMGILISHKKVDQDLIVESTKHKSLPCSALFYWCGFSCISVSLLRFVDVHEPTAGDSRAGSCAGQGVGKQRVYSLSL